jgi:hypothetical protein
LKRHLAPVLSENDFRAGSLLSVHLDIRRLFPGIFFGRENGFVSAANCFMPLKGKKQLHGIASGVAHSYAMDCHDSQITAPPVRQLTH